MIAHPHCCCHAALVSLICMIVCAAAGLDHDYILQIIGIFTSKKNCAFQNKRSGRLWNFRFQEGFYDMLYLFNINSASIKLLSKWLSKNSFESAGQTCFNTTMHS